MNKSIILTIIVILDSLSTVITNTKSFVEIFSWNFNKSGGGTTLFVLVILHWGSFLISVQFFEQR